MTIYYAGLIATSPETQHEFLFQICSIQNSTEPQKSLAGLNATGSQIVTLMNQSHLNQPDFARQGNALIKGEQPAEDGRP